jgi:hypothetical protein
VWRKQKTASRTKLPGERGRLVIVFSHVQISRKLDSKSNKSNCQGEPRIRIHIRNKYFLMLTGSVLKDPVSDFPVHTIQGWYETVN